MPARTRKKGGANSGAVSARAALFGHGLRATRVILGLDQAAFLVPSGGGPASRMSNLELGKVESYEKAAEEILQSWGLGLSDVEEVGFLRRELIEKSQRYIRSQPLPLADDEVREQTPKAKDLFDPVVRREEEAQEARRHLNALVDLWVSRVFLAPGPSPVEIGAVVADEVLRALEKRGL